MVGTTDSLHSRLHLQTTPHLKLQPWLLRTLRSSSLTVNWPTKPCTIVSPLHENASLSRWSAVARFCPVRAGNKTRSQLIRYLNVVVVFVFHSLTSSLPSFPVPLTSFRFAHGSFIPCIPQIAADLNSTGQIVRCRVYSIQKIRS